MYDELIKRLRETSVDFGESDHVSVMMIEAADAIEELQKQLREEKVDNVNLTGWLAEEHAKQCPHYIRNIHGRGDDSLCDKWICEVKSIPNWIPVTERLPDDQCDVLCDDEGRVVVGYYTDEEVGWHDLHSYKIYPTHWMPLPQPPEDGE